MFGDVREHTWGQDLSLLSFSSYLSFHLICRVLEIETSNCIQAQTRKPQDLRNENGIREEKKLAYGTTPVESVHRRQLSNLFMKPMKDCSLKAAVHTQFCNLWRCTKRLAASNGLCFVCAVSNQGSRCQHNVILLHAYLTKRSN